VRSIFLFLVHFEDYIMNCSTVIKHSLQLLGAMCNTLIFSSQYRQEFTIFFEFLNDIQSSKKLSFHIQLRVCWPVWECFQSLPHFWILFSISRICLLNSHFAFCLSPFIKSITEALFVSTLSLSSNLGALGQIVFSSSDTFSSLIISSPPTSSPET
jgi:hypothetical protein